MCGQQQLHYPKPCFCAHGRKHIGIFGYLLCVLFALPRLVRAALFSGCRYGELARLLVSDFDAGAATLFVSHSKSGKPRQVYLDPEATQFFGSVCDKHRSDFIFTDDGKQWKKDSAKGLMGAACKAAEIEPLTFHELRHSTEPVGTTSAVSR